MFKIVDSKGRDIPDMAVDALVDADWRRDFDNYTARFKIVEA